LIIVGIVILTNFLSHFKYHDIGFAIEKYGGNLVVYRTTFAVISGGKQLDYNVYLRNDPRELEKDIPFIGDLELKNDLVVNVTGDINCEGYGVISLANLVNLRAIGINVIRNESLGCDSQGRYLFLHISPGNVSEVKQTGTACYELSVSNCEVLKVTERFMTESFIKAKNL
jgi:hypothetical protein